jgi:hypothetical protein
MNSDITTEASSGISIDGWTVIMGSNKNFEFSAWQEGINYLYQHNISHRGILFANDTIGRHHKGSHFAQCNLNELMRRWSTCHGAQFIGIQHFSPQPLDLDGHDVTQWICTMIFGLTSEALKRIDYKVDHIEYAARMCSEKVDGFSILNQNTPSSIKRSSTRAVLGKMSSPSSPKRMHDYGLKESSWKQLQSSLSSSPSAAATRPSSALSSLTLAVAANATAASITAAAADDEQQLSYQVKFNIMKHTI